MNTSSICIFCPYLYVHLYIWCSKNLNPVSAYCRQVISLSLPVREGHNSPLSTPSPFPGLGAPAIRQLAESLVFTCWQSDNDIRFAGPESEDTNARLRAHWADGSRERCCGVPGSLGSNMLMYARAQGRVRGHLHHWSACDS